VPERHVSHGVNGWVGDSTIAVHRLLDSRRCAWRCQHLSSDFALTVRDVLDRDAIVHCGVEFEQ
jgi:hypothetical protein